MEDKDFFAEVIIATTTVLAEQLDVDRAMRGLIMLRDKVDVSTHARAHEFHSIIDRIGANLLDIDDVRAARKKPKH